MLVCSRSAEASDHTHFHTLYVPFKVLRPDGYRIFCSALLTATLGLGAASARIVPELEVSGTSRQLQDASDAPAEEETSEDSGFYSTVDPRLSEDMFNAVLGLFDTWNAALATLDSATVADLYAPNAVLLPTVSNDVRTDRAGIIDYFDYFLSIKPDGMAHNRQLVLAFTLREITYQCMPSSRQRFGLQCQSSCAICCIVCYAALS